MTEKLEIKSSYVKLDAFKKFEEIMSDEDLLTLMLLQTVNQYNSDEKIFIKQRKTYKMIKKPKGKPLSRAFRSFSEASYALHFVL